MLYWNVCSQLIGEVFVLRCPLVLFCIVQLLASDPVFPDFGLIWAFIDSQAMCFNLIGVQWSYAIPGVAHSLMLRFIIGRRKVIVVWATMWTLKWRWVELNIRVVRN
jgi:hypothetical protein